MKVALCSSNDFDDPGSRGFGLTIDDNTIDVFVIHRHGEFFAFINSCPHTGANLEWQEDQFLDMDKAFIQCATHDARFEIDTGLCVSGPCTGDSLKPLALSREGDHLYVDIDPAC